MAASDAATMHNRGYYIASLCEVVRWLGARPKRSGSTCSRVPAAQLLVRDAAVAGVRTAPAGLDRDGMPSLEAGANDLVAKVTGSPRNRGLLAQAWCMERVPSENPRSLRSA